MHKIVLRDSKLLKNLKEVYWKSFEKLSRNFKKKL